MSKIKFRDVKLSPANKERLKLINSIIEDYQQQGYVLTLRQLYYQLVSRDVVPNKQSEYSKLSTLLKEGRMGGIVDWSAIEDRLRQPYTPNEFNGPKDAMETIINVFRKKRMEGQPKYLEVWVEKDALSGVLKRVTSQYHVPILVNRGYSSCSSMFDSYNRFKTAFQKGKTCAVLYLGDFDPSGQDMIRDIKERIQEFCVRHYIFNVDEGDDFSSEEFREWFDSHFDIVPIALTMQQIRQYKPPVNPAKITDPRAKEYIAKHGKHSWEVDALPPEVLNALLDKAIRVRLDIDLYEEVLEREAEEKERMEELMDHL